MLLSNLSVLLSNNQGSYPIPTAERLSVATSSHVSVESAILDVSSKREPRNSEETHTEHAEHAWVEGHNIDWEGVSVLDREKQWN